MSSVAERIEAEAEARFGDDPDRQAADLIRRLSKSHRRVDDRIARAVDKAVAEAKVSWEQGQTRGSEQAVSETTEQYLAEIEAAEAEAAGLLDGPDGGGLDPRPAAVIKHLRAATKRHRKEIDRIRAEAITVARAELIAERQSEAGFRRLAVPPSARALFGDVDPTDQAVMAARADELRQAGVTWPGQPQPPGPPPPDPNLAAQVAMMAAAAGGGTPGSEGDLAYRMQKMEANPGAYTDEQHAAVVREYNAAVQAAGRHGTSGARG